MPYVRLNSEECTAQLVHRHAAIDTLGALAIHAFDAEQEALKLPHFLLEKKNLWKNRLEETVKLCFRPRRFTCVQL